MARLPTVSSLLRRGRRVGPPARGVRAADGGAVAVAADGGVGAADGVVVVAVVAVAADGGAVAADGGVGAALSVLVPMPLTAAPVSGIGTAEGVVVVAVVAAAAGGRVGAADGGVGAAHGWVGAADGWVGAADGWVGAADGGGDGVRGVTFSGGRWSAGIIVGTLMPETPKSRSVRPSRLFAHMRMICSSICENATTLGPPPPVACTWNRSSRSLS